MIIKSVELEGLCYELAQMKPNWDEIVKEYKINFDENKEYHMEYYHQNFQEIKLSLDLRKRAKKDKNLIIDPISLLHSTETEKYKVERCNLGNVKFTNKETKLFSAEYDNLILYYGQHVIFETTVGTLGNVKKNIVPQKICKKLMPFMDFVNEFPAYVVIVANDQYSRNTKRIPDFRKANGILIPFYTDISGYAKDIEQVVNDYKLPLKIKINSSELDFNETL